MPISQTLDDLKEHLKHQINFLNTSSLLYDRGNEGEAIRLAASVRILVHDTAISKSLLMQLGKKNILFHDTSRDLDYEFFSLETSEVGLAMIKLPPGRYFAPLDDVPPDRLNKKITFDSWWNKVVIIDKLDSKFTRKDLVLFVANEDGGAHVDPDLDEDMARLSRLNSLGWRVVKNGIDSPMQAKPELPCIRQIAHEVLKTLKDEFSEYF
jgi:hypothetical protein